MVSNIYFSIQQILQSHQKQQKKWPTKDFVLNYLDAHQNEKVNLLFAHVISLFSSRKVILCQNIIP